MGRLCAQPADTGQIRGIVTDVLFYHLTASSIDAALPPILGKALERGWRVHIQSPEEERIRGLDNHLWTFVDDSFLPHGRDPDTASDQPIYLTTREDVANEAEMAVYLDGALPEPKKLQKFKRVCIFFDGLNEDAVGLARKQWVTLKDAGLETKYWAQEDGKWTQKG